MSESKWNLRGAPTARQLIFGFAAITVLLIGLSVNGTIRSISVVATQVAVVLVPVALLLMPGREGAARELEGLDLVRWMYGYGPEGAYQGSERRWLRVTSSAAVVVLLVTGIAPFVVPLF